MTDEVVMVPVQEFRQLQEYYKGQMTENALLNKSGRLATEEHLILNDKRIPDSTAVKMTKPMASEEKQLVKYIRTGAAGPIAYRRTEEPEGMVDTPAENLLKQIIKGVNKNPNVPIVIEQEAASPRPSGIQIRKESSTKKPPIPPKPSTSVKKPSIAPSAKKPSMSKKKEEGFFKMTLEGAVKGA